MLSLGSKQRRVAFSVKVRIRRALERKLEEERENVRQIETAM